MDEPTNTSNTAEPDEFVPNVHPPTDDEGVRIKTFFDSRRILNISILMRYKIISVYQRRARKLLLCGFNVYMHAFVLT